ncbi:MAG: AMP-binding protein, partial [Anaerolineae bacterium]
VPYALIQLLLNGVLEERDCSSMRWVLYGGEPFPPKHMRGLQLAWPNATFSNVYGPAEVNQCTAFLIPPIAENDETPIPIGRMWFNTHGLIVDSDDQSVEPGDIGELIVRAPTMMQGYWKRPDLNKKAFYFDKKEGGIKHRYYRTGDLVQELPGGELVFLGRKDRQIKLRGYRVELDEVEAGLVSHEAVAEVAAYMVQKTDDDKMIQAAIILKESATADIQLDEFKRHLQNKVPKYAIPESFVIFKDFPRTGSGKVDRRKLQANASLTLIA